QILDHGEIEVERALLEYDAGHAQSLARRMSDVAAENPDMTALDGVEARDQREQRTLSSSVEAEQNGEGRWRDGEGHVVERLTPCRSNGSRLGWRRRAGRRSSFLASCRRPVPPALAKRTSHRTFPWVAEWHPPCLAPALPSQDSRKRVAQLAPRRKTRM